MSPQKSSLQKSLAAFAFAFVFAFDFSFLAFARPLLQSLFAFATELTNCEFFTRLHSVLPLAAALKRQQMLFVFLFRVFRMEITSLF